MGTQQRRQQVVIVGGGYAGMLAAARMTRGRPDAEITLVDARPDFVQRLRLHEQLAGGAPKSFAYAPLLARRGVRFVQGWVERLDAERQRVVGRAAAGERFELGYDILVLTLGSRTGAQVPGVQDHAVRLDDPRQVAQAAQRLRALAETDGRVLVVGGGLTGIETATELAEQLPGLRVGLVVAGRLGDGFAEAGERHFRRRFEELGIQLHEHSYVQALEEGHAYLAGGARLPFELCVWSAGFVVPGLAREAGLAVDEQGRVLVDGALRSLSHPAIFAAGDIARPSFPVRVGCVSAMPMGAHVGANVRRLLRGEEPAPFKFGSLLRCISLGRRDGLVQFTDRDDHATERVLTGRLAALTKELICAGTYMVVRNELRTALPLLAWSQPDREPAPTAEVEAVCARGELAQTH